MAEKYPAGSIVRPKTISTSLYKVSDKDYTVISEKEYLARHPDVIIQHNHNDEWVYIVQDNGDPNGYPEKYFDLVYLKPVPVMCPDMSLDEIHAGQEALLALTQDKPRS